MRNITTSKSRQAQRFAEVTQKSIVSGNFIRAKRCLAIAEKLLQSENCEIKNAISGIYVHSVSCFMELHRVSVSRLFPERLKAEYVTQINTTGI